MILIMVNFKIANPRVNLAGASIDLFCPLIATYKHATVKYRSSPISFRQTSYKPTATYK